jgi:hypothetical protein
VSDGEVEGVGPTVVSPKEPFTFADLRTAAIRYHDGVSTGEWTTDGGELFLKLHGLNKKYCIAAEENALREKAYRAMEGEGGDDDEDEEEEEELDARERLRTDHHLHPDRYEAIIPPSWETPGADVSEFIDCIMHQLFLGVRRTTWFMVEKWCAQKGCLASLKRAQVGLFEQVQRLQLDWAMALPCAKRKSYVAENWLLAVRLERWAHACIGDLKADDVPYTAPEGHHSKWNGKECGAFLRAHGLDASGLKEDKLERVRVLFREDPEGRRRGLVGSNVCPASKVQHMLNAELCFVARVMCDEVNASTEADVDRYAKIMLDAVEGVDRVGRAPAQVPKWLKTGNMISMLNLSSHLGRYGPLRSFWEGDGKGEAFLQALKAIFRRMRGLKPGWAKWVVRRFYALRASKIVFGSEAPPVDNEEETKTDWVGGGGGDTDSDEDSGDDGEGRGAGRSSRYRPTRVYGSRDEVEADVRAGRVIATVCVRNLGGGDSTEHLGVLVSGSAGGRSTPDFIRLDVCDTGGVLHGGAPYLVVSAALEGTSVATPLNSNFLVTHCCLSLPRLLVTGNGELHPDCRSLYYTISSMWQDLVSFSPHGGGCQFRVPTM